MAPLPEPRTPSDTILHDVALSLRKLAGREDENEPGTVELREPVSGVDATPTKATSKGKTKPAPETEPSDSSPDLDGMKRAELDEYAAKVGVSEPDKLPNIAAVKAAIAEAS